MPTPTHWQETQRKFPNPVSGSIPSETDIQHACEGRSPMLKLRADTLTVIKTEESSSHTQEAENCGHR